MRVTDYFLLWPFHHVCRPPCSRPEAYCMPRFAADCSHPDNFGCIKRCSLYLIITYHCVTDAYDTATRRFNPDCMACNMCWDRSPPMQDRSNHMQDKSQHVRGRLQHSGLQDNRTAWEVPYALLWARGPSGALFENHWLVRAAGSRPAACLQQYGCVRRVGVAKKRRSQLCMMWRQALRCT